MGRWVRFERPVTPAQPLVELQGGFESPPPAQRALPDDCDPAIPIREGCPGCACPAPRWSGTWPARSLREWLEWLHTNTRRDGARSNRGRSTRLQIEENTRSGVPGRVRSCRRYLRPRAWRVRRRTTSGAVSLLPTAAIMRERVAPSTMSGIFLLLHGLASSAGSGSRRSTRSGRRRHASDSARVRQPMSATRSDPHGIQESLVATKVPAPQPRGDPLESPPQPAVPQRLVDRLDIVCRRKNRVDPVRRHESLEVQRHPRFLRDFRHENLGPAASRRLATDQSFDTMEHRVARCNAPPSRFDTVRDDEPASDTRANPEACRPRRTPTPRGARATQPAPPAPRSCSPMAAVRPVRDPLSRRQGRTPRSLPVPDRRG